MNNGLQELYRRAMHFAALKHASQKVPGTDLPYVVHIGNVAMEVLIASQFSAGFNTGLAVQCALLHDVLEDTQTTSDELSNLFPAEVVAGVQALTKTVTLPAEQRMSDSLARIKMQPSEIGAVKLADRITNLQPPPAHWSKEKIREYWNEANSILNELSLCNDFLGNRLALCIADYKRFF